MALLLEAFGFAACGWGMMNAAASTVRQSDRRQRRGAMVVGLGKVQGDNDHHVLSTTYLLFV